MITIISGTNRPGSRTRQVCGIYSTLLSAKGVENQILDIADLPEDSFASSTEVHQGLEAVISEFIQPVNALIIISPEYNGSIPGVLKALIDHSDVKAWYGKKSCLTGIASGRAGNLRGLDHLASVLMHCKGTVLPNKLPISSIHTVLNEGEIGHEETAKAIENQIDEFLAFI
ncbi:MAG: chromate reductase [Limisphaerales bacterium]|jgi:chromate reductase